MHNSQAYWSRILFKLQIFKVSGDAFMNLVHEIAKYGDPSFQQVQPWGNLGDGGSDGWFPNEGRYLQIYGPRASTKDSTVSAAKKAVEDFDKLKSNWSGIRIYNFVYNDRYAGPPAPLLQSLIKLKKSHSLLESLPWVASDLEGMFMQLSSDQKEMVIGGIPSDYPEIRYPELKDILQNLADSDSFTDLRLGEDAPNLEEKLKFNGLSQEAKVVLNYSVLHTRTVDKFLRSLGGDVKQLVPEAISDIYRRSLKEFIGHQQAADLRFGWMQEELIPEKARRHIHSLKAYREAARVLIAKYFETCDVYEEPPKTCSE